MSEMKLSLQVQLDSHIFQTCRGREKKPCSKQGHPWASTAKFYRSSLLQWCRGSLPLIKKRQVSALMGYGGDTKDVLKTITHGIPVRYLHQTCYTQSTSLPCHNFRQCNTAGSTSCGVRRGIALGWVLAPKHPVTDMREDAEPRPAWWPRAVLTPCGPPGSNRGASKCLQP